MGSFRNSGTYTSPGTPEHGDISMVETPKGWSSERVAMPNSSSRRHISYATALIPFNSGRALPSKWDDAERWIKSPVSGHKSSKAATAETPQRPKKSKSGPLGSSGLVRLSNYSPTLGAEIVNNFVGNAMSNGFSSYDAGIGVKSSQLYCENSIARSTSVPGLSNFLGETSVPSSQVGFDDGTKEEDGIVPRRDTSNQMSPKGSVISSSKRTFLYSILNSSPLGINTNPAAEDEIRDVQVDKSTSTDHQSNKQGQTNAGKLKNVQVKLLKEEAKISAWENLQQAKADAAIQKLEMKLEKKRSESMDKILNKLRAAQMKAESMRNSVLTERHENRARRNSCLGSSCGIFVNSPPLIAREDSP